MAYIIKMVKDGGQDAVRYVGSSSEFPVPERPNAYKISVTHDIDVAESYATIELANTVIENLNIPAMTYTIQEQE